MNKNLKLIVLVAPLVGQIWLSIRFFSKSDIVGGFVALFAFVIWTITLIKISKQDK